MVDVDVVLGYRLQALKEKLKQQQKHLDDLDKHMYVGLHATVETCANSFSD